MFQLSLGLVSLLRQSVALQEQWDTSDQVPQQQSTVTRSGVLEGPTQAAPQSSLAPSRAPGSP